MPMNLVIEEKKWEKYLLKTAYGRNEGVETSKKTQKTAGYRSPAAFLCTNWVYLITVSYSLRNPEY